MKENRSRILLERKRERKKNLLLTRNAPIPMLVSCQVIAVPWSPRSFNQFKQIVVEDTRFGCCHD